ncbi:MAG: DUF349 domain-containing protein [Bacteroidetes bacterium]|nr:DUF349 domain-containing protein [Bacteroidota bacterium]
MENGTELRDEKEVVIAPAGMPVAEDASILSEESTASAEWIDDKILDAELPSETKPIDYASLDKKDFVGLLKEAAAHDDFRKADQLIRDIKPLFDEIRNTERTEALIRFKQNGGIDEDFEYKGDEWDQAFDIYVRSIRENRQRHIKELEEQKNANLQTKTNLLESLRQLVDGEDNEHSLRQFKDIQRDWKKVGPVPQSHIKTLWANYNALVDRFYDQRSIHFELKELDRKRNLEQKLELITRAERLLEVEKISEAVRELNELHNEYRHIGPVPMEEKEALWQKFKAASDAVYAKRDAAVAVLQVELQKNLEEKEKINEEVAVFASYQTDRIKEWNEKTKEIVEIQKRWEAIGGVPHAKTKDVNKKFWNSFKAFFHNKNVFFKKLDEERNNNLQLKSEILKKAIELKDSDHWDAAANELKALQAQWKEIGPVPEKQREKIFKQFKEACDFFFEKKRSSMNEEEKEQHENLIKKEAIITELEKIAEEKNGSLSQVKELQHQFMAIGFVPKRSVASVKSRFTEVLNSAIASLPLEAGEKENAAFEVQLTTMRQGPQGDKKIHNKEYSLRKQIAKAENDIATLRNNLEFFGRSKNAEKLKEEFNEKIRLADEDLAHLKKQLQMLHTAS